MQLSDPQAAFQTPCPYRVVEDLGGAYAMGLVGGGLWYGVKGAKNAPKGARSQAARAAVSARAPTLGGNFAVWGGLFSSYSCALMYARGRDDIWNPIMSGAATGATLAIRGGLKVAGKNAIVGGCLLALIEGVSMAISKFSSQGTPRPGEALPQLTGLSPKRGPGAVDANNWIQGQQALEAKLRPPQHLFLEQLPTDQQHTQDGSLSQSSAENNYESTKKGVRAKVLSWIGLSSVTPTSSSPSEFSDQQQRQ